jgi:hypothetical protein
MCDLNILGTHMEASVHLFRNRAMTKRLGNRYGLQLMRHHMFLASKKLTIFTPMNKGVGIRDGSGQKNPYLYVFPMSDLATA